jgi:hypothetical protein
MYCAPTFDIFENKIQILMFKKILFFLLLLPVWANAQSLKYGTGTWNADSLGNHRVVLQVNGNGRVASAHVEWRRRDVNPEAKNLRIEDASGQRVQNVLLGKITREVGEFYFEPISGAGTYYAYYMPNKRIGRSANYPNIVYPPFKSTASAEWLALAQNRTAAFPAATPVEMQSISEFHSFYPMEVIATAAETEALRQKLGNATYALFPEDRLHSIRMTDDLPQRWIERSATGAKLQLEGEAARNEYFAFQIGVWAAKKDLNALKVTFSDFKAERGSAKISAQAFTCFNLGGINWDGKPFSKTLNVAKNKVQALWMGAQIPRAALAGKYTGTVTIQPAGEAAQTVVVTLNVNNQILADGGDSTPEKMTRLKWLNSTLGQDDTVIPPYSPLQVRGHNIGLLGRNLVLNRFGLPEQIQSFFTPEMTSIGTRAQNMLSAPMSFNINDANGNVLTWTSQDVQFVQKQGGKVVWKATNKAQNLELRLTGQMEFDGHIEYALELVAIKDINLQDIRLEMPIKKEFATYWMGLGLRGGFRPPELKWKWDQKKNQEGGWIGAVNGGLQYTLRAENYSRPLNTNFYQQKPLNMPPSWYNNGNGGIDLSEQGASVLVKNYSGARSLKAGETLHFNFTLLLTPFHPINPEWQFKTRFYHRYSKPDEVIQAGANVVNIHHANEINPYINYPFIHTRQMKDYIAEAHSKGLKVKIYNTVRELSNRAYELWALRSLGNEIYSDGRGGGYSWLQEHIGGNYIAAWFVPEWQDAAIINSGMSRWHNYYIEGMNWLVKNIGIDGIYLDDVAFDRTTMKRLRRVLKPDGIIDLHSANQYNPSDGFTNSANLYLEHFPYLNRLWFGEYFDYDMSPDFWMVEVSGLPYGLMGEMLEKGGNKWRGMVYGMTNRYPWSADADPRPIWKSWDEFGIITSKMIGYWSPNCPVKTNNPNVLATVYQKDKTALIALASWAKEDVKVKLNINWAALGIDASKAKLVAMDVKDFQPAATFAPSDEITVPAGKGWMLVVKE